MWPTLLEVETAAGPIGVHTYGLFIVLAFSSAFLYVHFRAIRIGLHPDRLIGAYLSAAAGGLVGGRLLYAIAVEPARTLAEPWSLFNFAGFAVYGGILGGIAGVLTFLLLSKIDVWKMSDIAGPSVVIGMGVGRFGCFFAGCCHGAAAPVGPNPIGLLPEGLLGGQIWLSGVAPFITQEVYGGVTRADLLNTPLYPTQLWAILFLLPLAGVLAWLWKRRQFDGQIAALTLMVEPPSRALFEAFRADHRGYAIKWPVSESLAAALPPGMTKAGEDLGGELVAGITTSQFIGLGMMAAGVAIYALRHRTGVATETPLVVAEDDLPDDLEEFA